MPDRAQTRQYQLTETLRSSCGHLGIGGLHLTGQGMDARVYRGTSPDLGPVAIKLPHDRWVSSGNEPHLDTRLLLRQESQLSRHLREHGLPVPEVFLFHTGDDGVDFTISAFIESDGTRLADDEFGRLIRAIHDIPVPAVSLAAMAPSPHDADEVLADRIGQRLKNLATIVDLGTGTPDIGSALAASRRDAPACLLHMDLRAENILTRDGHPAALLDWSNALAGDAALDLARAAEYGSLTGRVLSAYGNPDMFSMEPRTPRETVYRLDTAVMLSHVFLDGAPDNDMARHYIDRTRNLCTALLRS